MSNPLTESLAQYVQRSLRQKKLSLADVERNCDGKITSSYLSRILKGTVKNLSVEKIAALARGLDVDPHEIFAASLGSPPLSVGVQHMIAPAVFIDAAQKLLINPDLLELTQMLSRMSANERKTLLVTLNYVENVEQRSGKKKRT